MDIDKKYSNNYTVDNFKDILLNKINISEKIEPKIASIIDKNFFNVKSLKEFYIFIKLKIMKKVNLKHFMKIIIISIILMNK